MRLRKATEPPARAPKQHQRVDNGFFAEILTFVKKQRSASVTLDEKLDILLLYGKLRHDFEQAQTDTRPGRKPARCGASERIAELLHHRKLMVQQVWQGFISERTAKVCEASANCTPEKNARLPTTNALVATAQAFARQRRQIGVRTAARDVMNFCGSAGFLSFDRSSRTSVAAALKAVQ